MPSVAEVRRRIEAMGGELEEDEWAFQACAPIGKSWRCDPGVHMLCAPFENGAGQRFVKEAMADLAERIADGLEDCTDPTCDYCHPEA